MAFCVCFQSKIHVFVTFKSLIISNMKFSCAPHTKKNVGHLAGTCAGHVHPVSKFRKSKCAISVAFLCFFRVFLCSFVRFRGAVPVGPYSTFSMAPGAGGAGTLFWVAWHMRGALLALFGHGLFVGSGGAFLAKSE